MKTLSDDKIKELTAIVGEEPSSSVSLPKAGKITVKAMTVQPGVPQRNDKGELTGEVSKQWVRVDFNEGGALSLNGILRSPDLTWNGLDKNADRIKALCTAELTFTHQESLTSRAGQPYKRNHFVPQTISAAPTK